MQSAHDEKVSFFIWTKVSDFSWAWHYVKIPYHIDEEDGRCVSTIHIK